MPMSASAVVNRAEILAMLSDLEEGLDSALADSDRLLGRRDDVLAEARREAENLLADARHEREGLVSDTEVYRLARRRADELVAAAEADAAGLRAETDEYVDGKLATFEITLERTIEAVRRGRERLAGRSALDSLTEDEADKIRLPEHLDG